MAWRAAGLGLPVAGRAGWSALRVGVTLAACATLAWALATVGEAPTLLAAAAGLWARPDLLAVFAVTYAGAFGLRALAWGALLESPVAPARLFGILHVALLVNHVLPTKAGEVARAALLLRAGVPLGPAVAGTLAARVIDLAALGLIAGLALAAGAAAAGTRAPLVAAAAVAAAVAVAWAARRPLAGLALRTLPGALPRQAQSVVAAVVALPARRVGAAALLAGPSWVLEAGALWCVGQAAGQPIALPVAVAATAVTIVFQTFQVTPGGIGLYEASMTAALAAFGVHPAVGLPLAVATHGLKFAYSYGVGVPCLLVEVLLGGRPGAPARLGTARQLARALCWAAALALVAPVLAPRLWRQARRAAARPPAAPLVTGRVAVVIPVHNEAHAVAGVVAGVPRQALAERGFETTVVVVDDGSTDGSGELARAAGADLVLRHATRRGLGAALRSGLEAARDLDVDAAVYLDGDGEYDPADVLQVAAPVLAGTADYVLGNRFPRAAVAMRPSRRWGNLAFTWLMRALTGLPIGDAQTGVRAFSRRALARAEVLHDYNYAQVLTIRLLSQGMRLAEAPVSYRVRSGGRSFIRYLEYAANVFPAMVRALVRG